MDWSLSSSCPIPCALASRRLTMYPNSESWLGSFSNSSSPCDSNTLPCFFCGNRLPLRNVPLVLQSMAYTAPRAQSSSRMQCRLETFASVMMPSLVLSFPRLNVGLRRLSVFSTDLRLIPIGASRTVTVSSRPGLSSRRTFPSLVPHWQCVTTRSTRRLPTLSWAAEPRRMTSHDRKSHATAAPESSVSNCSFAGALKCSKMSAGTGNLLSCAS
mmetsp:Transcript_32724/g.74237  ORF Transcript_32724/g.74237 Transcript_32724/m.74237 type:complete len:214 (-) Transcript_32724:252-893(-)